MCPQFTELRSRCNWKTSWLKVISHGEMESYSVQYQKILHDFLQSFSFNLGAEPHVDEKESQKKNLWLQNWYHEVGARINLQCWIRVHHTAWGIADWTGILISQALRNQDETGTKTQRQVLKYDTEMTILFQVSREIGTRDESAFKYRETMMWSTESTCRGEVDPPQSRDLQYSIHWESLRECSIKVESSRRRSDRFRPISQCINMGIINVNINESSDTTWLQWEVGHLQEIPLQDTQDVLGHHV